VIDVELAGLRIFGRHGVTDDERERGQDFLFDIRMRVADDALSDRIEDAVDYREVADAVRELSDARRFALLEALAAAVADLIVHRFAVEHVTVRVRKPEVRPAGLDVDWTAATVERSR
jgi:7,8-dihydroneopterin aldolase/epimerase/oxygenase